MHGHALGQASSFQSEGSVTGSLNLVVLHEFRGILELLALPFVARPLLDCIDFKDQIDLFRDRSQPMNPFSALKSDDSIATAKVRLSQDWQPSHPG